MSTTPQGEGPVVRVVDAPLASPTATAGLLEVFRRRYLLRLLVRRELNARYSGSMLGMLWSYVNPLSQLFIYWFVMGKIMNLHGEIENFPLHIFAALIVVHFFTETFGAGTRSIVRNKALVRKMALPREMFPVASMLVSGVNALPQIGIMVVICLMLGWTPDAVGVLAFFLAIAIVAALGTALALIFSVANVFFRDFSQVVMILTNFVRFGVPMIYPFTMVAKRFGDHAELYLANPLCEAVLCMQRAFWAGTASDPDHIYATHFPDHLILRSLIALGASLVVLVIAQLVFTKFENKIPEQL